MRMDINRKINCLFQCFYKDLCIIRSQKTCHILDTQGISAHILDSLCNVFPIIQCICITQCIAQRYLCVCFFFVGCLYRCLQVADII